MPRCRRLISLSSICPAICLSLPWSTIRWSSSGALILQQALYTYLWRWPRAQALGMTLSPNIVNIKSPRWGHAPKIYSLCFSRIRVPIHSWLRLERSLLSPSFARFLRSSWSSHPCNHRLIWLQDLSIQLKSTTPQAYLAKRLTGCRFPLLNNRITETQGQSVRPPTATSIHNQIIIISHRMRADMRKTKRSQADTQTSQWLLLTIALLKMSSMQRAGSIQQIRVERP
jgi:hypothetical protein